MTKEKGKKNPSRIAPKLPTKTHGLYWNPVGTKLDRRTKEYRSIVGITKALLEIFPEPAPAVAQVLAGRLAYKIVRALWYEVHVLTEGKSSPHVDNPYVSLSNSIRADLETLHRMGRDAGPVERVPSLAEYLAALKAGKIKIIDPE